MNLLYYPLPLTFGEVKARVAAELAEGEHALDIAGRRGGRRGRGLRGGRRGRWQGLLGGRLRTAATAQGALRANSGHGLHHLGNRSY